jgi:amidophosphoribosyltransferase
MRDSLSRLLKPLEFYKEKYGTAFYGIQKMYLLMEKQHNRGWCWFCKYKSLIWNQVKDILVECDQIMLNNQDVFAQINDRVNEEMAAHRICG